MPLPAVSEWDGYLVEEFSFTDYAAGSRVVDVGFGTGEQLRSLAANGCIGIGVDIDPTFTAEAKRTGLRVCRAAAERLPFRTGAFDGIICKVVVPYTDEAAAIREFARVLRRGGVARVAYHGVGYNVRYLLEAASWQRRVYGARVIVNTLVYASTGRRLPGFWGDTIYQSERRLRRHYAAAGLEVVQAVAGHRFMGAPVFIYHVLTRR